MQIPLEHESQWQRSFLEIWSWNSDSKSKLLRCTIYYDLTYTAHLASHRIDVELRLTEGVVPEMFHVFPVSNNSNIIHWIVYLLFTTMFSGFIANHHVLHEKRKNKSHIKMMSFRVNHFIWIAPLFALFWIVRDKKSHYAQVAEISTNLQYIHFLFRVIDRAFTNHRRDNMRWEISACKSTLDGLKIQESYEIDDRLKEIIYCGTTTHMRIDSLLLFQHRRRLLSFPWNP